MNLDNQLRVVLLRHGETVYNIEKRLQSPKDRLTDFGKKQIELLYEDLSKFNFSKIISSDETRAIETADILSKKLGLKFKPTPLIREKNNGIFSNMLVSEVDWSKIKGNFLDKKIPGGESVREVSLRAEEFVKELNTSPQGETILVISHGTFIRILFCLIFKKDIENYLLNYDMPNGSYSVIIRSKDGKWFLEKSSLFKKNKNG